MTPRLMIICLGGLAGAGALVCCELDEGSEPQEAAPEGEADGDGAEAVEAAPDASAVH